MQYECQVNCYPHRQNDVDVSIYMSLSSLQQRAKLIPIASYKKPRHVHTLVS